MYPTLVVHIAAGLLAISLGYVALSTAKGGRWHRVSGRAFVYSMSMMALLGAWLAATHDKAPRANVPIGLLTAYLVITGLTTVRPPRANARQLHILLALLALVVGLVLLGFGVQAANAPAGTLQGIPTLPFFIFGTVAVLASVSDFRLIRAGGVHLLRGTRRLTRHLWRMCFAHLIAAFSFFLGQAKVFPKQYRIVPLLIIPPLIVLAALLYWLWRVRFSRSLRARIANGELRLASSMHQASALTGEKPTRSAGDRDSSFAIRHSSSSL
jgi:uncharacterized membrane protein